MTLLHNDPRDFADEALAGFAAAHPALIRTVHGGVVRATASPAGQVAVVLGGGTGHYPAFAGWVGPGFAHGAACGNIFASPSASQICSVARAAHRGGGVIFSFGNYAGDVLHFGLAAEQLRAEGIDVRVLTVTDDIASAPAGEPGLRRGIAGDLPVMKILGAAAEAGLGLDEVERIGRRANAATRTLGLAFDGCTLPGAGRPLFTVERGRMGVGLGIHGEPGIEERPLPTADRVADLLVDGVLGEREAAGGTDGCSGRVAVLLNGLGATKYEELYVVHRRVAERLAAEGLHAVAPEVGEQVTSLGMAGLSLTLTFLDPELESLWTAPAYAPAFRRGAAAPHPPRTDDLTATREVPPVVPGSRDSRAAAARIAGALRVVRDTVTAHEQRLGDIDSVAGDGDHGIGMRRGAEAAVEAAEQAVTLGAGARTTLARAGAAWSERGGGTSGALWGAALTAYGTVLGDGGSGSVLVAASGSGSAPAPAPVPATASGSTAAAAAPGSAAALASGSAVASGSASGASALHAVAVRAWVDAVMRLGGARPGDKTLVDAAIPFADALEHALPDRDFAQAWRQAAAAASAAAEATASITASRGRARTHGDRSLGTPDAGAVSFALIVTALSDHFNHCHVEGF